MSKILHASLALLGASIMVVEAQAQTTNYILKGRFVAENGLLPIVNTPVALVEAKLLVYTDGDGNFIFTQVPKGNYTLRVGNELNKTEDISIVVGDEVTELGTIVIVAEEGRVNGTTTTQLPTIALEESDNKGEDDGISDQSISGVLSASRDPFLQAAAYTFGNFRYQLRGYNRNQLEVYMNGLLMNDIELGSAFWGQWGGLNDIFRNQAITFGLQPSEDGFGGLQGASSLNVTAANQNAQTRISYARTNRNYRNRLMVTHSTGLMKNGWAVSVSASKRWAEEGYIPGTFYDGYSYYLGLSKKLNDKSMLHFTTFGSPTQRGKAAGALQEVMDLAGDNYYNPNWGYIDGDKRNARVNNTFQPIAILNWEYKPNINTIINIGASYQWGYNGNSSIDWYNAMDPRPDYYRNLPSYYLYNTSGVDSAAAAYRQNYFQNNPDKLQINWDRMYQANMMNYTTVNGVSGHRSVYIIGEDREDINKASLFANIKKVINTHIKAYGGLTYQTQMTDNYRRVLDLLGGDYYVNLNQFGERTYIGNDQYNQNNLLNPNEIVREGDKYNYHYKSSFQKAFAWGQAQFNYNKWDAFVAARAGYEQFSREGMYQYGIFPTESYGKSDAQSFFTYQVKGGATYKINGRNYLYLSGMLGTEAPTFDNTFISPRTRNITVPNPTLESIATVEGGYLMKSPNINARLSAFATDINNTTQINRFYHEDYRTFVNYVMTNVDMRMMGAEFALQAKLTPTLSATVVGSYMQAFYNSRPDVAIYRDNDTTKAVGTSTAYIQNYYLAAGPQTATTLGLNYRSPQYWYANINFNFVDRNYVSINPSRRTTEAIDGLEEGSEMYHKIIDQEKLPSAFTVDLFMGKSFALNKLSSKLFKYGTYLYLNVGVNNVLNNKSVTTGGYEQLRFDYTGRNPDRFGSKYFYGYGANYFVNVTFKF